MRDNQLPELEVACESCKGTGGSREKEYDPFEHCITCVGTGYVPTPAGKAILSLIFRQQLSVYCRECCGSGRESYSRNQCRNCHGSGRAPTEQGETLLAFISNRFRFLLREATE